MPLFARDLFNLQGKVALTTGGNRGDGRMIPSAFVTNGVGTYITGRDAVVTADAAAELAEREPALHIEQQCGHHPEQPPETFPESDRDRIMELNVQAVFFLTRQLNPPTTTGHGTSMSVLTLRPSSPMAAQPFNG